jgi:hypothetical protein
LPGHKTLAPGRLKPGLGLPILPHLRRQKPFGIFQSRRWRNDTASL